MDAPDYAIDIDVATRFLADQSAPEDGRYVFAYTIHIRNRGRLSARLIDRHWIITDANGKTEEVRGEGVVGEQPVIEPGGSYDYVSGCPLQTPTGAMEGSYHMVCEDGSSFQAVIPRFPLIGPAVTP